VAGVSIAIQAHPSRREHVDELVRALGPDVTVAWARPPFATTTDWRPIWRTKREAMLMGEASGAPFHCVLQDDVVLVPHFRERLEALVDLGPYAIYMLFFRMKRAYAALNGAAQSAMAAGTGGFATRRGPILGPGLVFSRDAINDIVRFGDRDPGMDGDDDRMRRWVRASRRQVFIAIPSLVDHRGDQSLIGHAGRRVAWQFA
jgi:hypothetical protein